MDYSYFQKLWLDKEHADIYVELYKLWPQPASVIAKYVEIERTRAYRKLLNMSKLWIIKETQRHKIKHFFIDDLWDLQKLVEKKNKEIEYLNKNKDNFFTKIKELKQAQTNTPKISLYESWEWVNNIFEDILQTIKIKEILTIRIFASNTIEERWEWWKMWEYASNFFKSLEKENIHIDEYIWVWNLIMERVEHFVDSTNLSQLPAAKSSANIILVWNILYFIVYDNAPIWIKIENDNLSDAIHILFDEIKRLKKLV